jgi:sigma-B regulation protein RsbU (phosphoserine phosphatase)
MSIRWKFLLILLGFSITPLLVFFVLNYQVSHELGRESGQVSKSLLLSTSRKELRDAVENYARNVGRETRLVDDSLNAYAQALTREITAASPAPAGLPGRLKSLMEKNLELLNPIGDYLVRQCVVLPGSLATCLPELAVETAGQPEGLWAVQSDPGVAVWFMPDTEGEVARSAAVTVAVPLRLPGGRAGGSIFLEIDMLKLLENIKAASQWTPFMSSWLVRLEADPKKPTAAARALAVRSLPEHIDRWQVPDPSSQAEVSRFLEAAGILGELKRWVEGAGLSVYKGADVLWAYAGAPNGWVFVALLPQQEVIYRLTQSESRLGRFYTLDALLAAASVMLALIVVATLRSKRMIRPFLAMVAAFKHLSEGDFTARLDTTAGDERKMVADAFNRMAGQLQESMRIRQALEVAREVQQNFLPESDVQFPGFDIAAQVQYCEETGGDYIDFIAPGKGKLGIVVSDVTGHGIGAALLMATARALVRGRYGENGSLADMMNSVNRKLSADIGETGRFMTLFFLEVDAASRGLNWIRAGHDPAWLLPSNGGALRLLDGPGIALGVDERYTYTVSAEGSLSAGDTIIIGTDGIWETIGPAGAIFGKKRLEELLIENASRSAHDICAAVLSAINAFRGHVRQEDDISLVVIKATSEAR